MGKGYLAISDFHEIFLSIATVYFFIIMVEITPVNSQRFFIG